MATDPASSVDSFDSVRDGILQYKIPLLFVVFGVVLVGTAVRIVLSAQTDEAPVVFDTQSVSSSGSGSLRVDVAGAVNKPGVYTFPVSSRVDDAINAAGGLADDADGEWLSKQLNRAAKLVDGGKIYIPGKAEKQVSTGQVAGIAAVGVVEAGNTKVQLNHATQAELEALPGIGPATATKIINGRPYQTIEELRTKKIMGAAAFDKVKDMIAL